MNEYWIPVTSHYPVEDGPYLIYAPSAYEVKPLIYVAWRDTTAQRWGMIAEIWAEAVTHWMPLPTPPKVEMKRPEQSSLHRRLRRVESMIDEIASSSALWGEMWRKKQPI